LRSPTRGNDGKTQRCDDRVTGMVTNMIREPAVPTVQMLPGMGENDNLEELTKLRNLLFETLNGSNGKERTKESIRQLHVPQRQERSQAESALLSVHGKNLLTYFAEGSEVEPDQITPKLVLVNKSDSLEGHLFRIATLLWSVPVSKGYGRRMRYLVLDEHNHKLLGILALGDPVFNLRCRDQWIGWNVIQRKERLSFVLDAYVLGAVPPYSSLLGSKVVGALIASSEIRSDFRNKYGNQAGLISKVKKDAHLVLATTTSALGRSSVYNRLHLPGLVEFIKIGTTEGWGHFLVTDDIFKQVRLVLKAYNDPYYDNYKFGQGPNWRLRALRKACTLLNMDSDLLRHGIKREAYAIPLATNWKQILLGLENKPEGCGKTCFDIGFAAVERWVIPRAERCSDWVGWRRSDTWQALTKYNSALSTDHGKATRSE